MISCDEVFDVLTRGPFPTGRPSDGVVEAHLGRCADCQRLAEALRPAVELFEAVAPEESRTLPSYGGRLPSTVAPLPWEATLAEVLPAVAKPELTRAKVPQRQSLLAAFLSGCCPVNLVRFAMAALLGAVIVGTAYQMGLPQWQAFAKRFQIANAGGEIGHPQGKLQATVKGVNLFFSPDCLSLVSKGTSTEDRSAYDNGFHVEQLASAANLPVFDASDVNVCCTKCHIVDYEAKTLAMKQATAQVWQTCNVCHDLSKLAH